MVYSVNKGNVLPKFLLFVLVIEIFQDTRTNIIFLMETQQVFHMIKHVPKHVDE